MGTDRNGDHGAEVEGTRITVYTLLPHFLDPDATESYISQLYGLKPEQVAAARAYALRNADVVLDRHLQIEAAQAAGNPATLVESASKTRATLLRFKEWLAQRESGAGSAREASEASQGRGPTQAETIRTFKQWLAEHES